MSKGYYNNEGLWVAPFEQYREEEQLRVALMALHEGLELTAQDREFLIEHDYDPDTGEYNE